MDQHTTNTHTHTHTHTHNRSCVKRLPRESAIVHDTSSFDTGDNEDHTFSGIMFNVSCGNTLPIAFCRIDSIWVRGCLGQ